MLELPQQVFKEKPLTPPPPPPLKKTTYFMHGNELIA